MSTQVNIQLAYKNSAWFSSNPTLILKEGQHVYLSDGADEYADAYVIGDGVNDLQSLPWRGVLDVIIVGDQYVLSGPTLTLPYTPIVGSISGYLNGARCAIGAGKRILDITGNVITFDDDYTGYDFIIDCRHT